MSEGICIPETVMRLVAKFPLSAETVVLLTGLGVLSPGTAVQPVLEPGFKLLMVLLLILYQKVIVPGVIFPSFLHCSNV